MKKILIILFVLIFLILFAVKLNKKEEVKIGFVGALTEKYSVLGNAMRNGILLAFEENKYIVNDKKIELLFKDDKNDKELNKLIINNYINQDIKIVIGNVTSSMSKISMSIINKHEDMFMISAASASNEFTGIDDQFFRVHVANNAQRFDSFTKYILKQDFKKVYGIFDPQNKTYTKDYIDNFEKSFISNGGGNFIKKTPSSLDLDSLVLDIKSVKPDLILFCVNSIDAARIVQYLRINKINTQLASSEWAMTNTFLENSGRHSENIIFNIDYNQNAKNKKFLDFVQNYKDKYNDNPSMFASKGYELSKIIIQLLEEGKETELKKNLLEKREFEGLQDTIVFDEYGDVIRNFINFRVKNGEFVIINE